MWPCARRSSGSTMPSGRSCAGSPCRPASSIARQWPRSATDSRRRRGSVARSCAPSSEEIRARISRDLELTIECMKDLHRRGVRVLPGGDYGFMWSPHGNNARDLAYFVDLLGFTPMEAIVGATRLGGEIMGMPESLGQVRKGFLADLLLVEGDPRADVRILQDRERLLAIMQNGAFHKTPPPDVAQRRRVAA